MTKIATVTNKKQITIPAMLFRKVGFYNGQKILVRELDGDIILSSFDGIVNELAGSLKSPKRWQGKNIDKIIDSAKKEYLTKREIHKNYRSSPNGVEN